MIRVRIYLKSGAYISLFFEDLVVEHRADDIIEFTWISARDTEEVKYETLKYIRLEDISAIVKVPYESD